MVMRNRHDGTDTPGWWDDLPPALRKRFSSRACPEPRREPSGDDPVPYRPGVVSSLSWLAAFFLVVALANLLFLLIALSYLFGGPLGQ